MILERIVISSLDLGVMLPKIPQLRCTICALILGERLGLIWELMASGLFCKGALYWVIQSSRYKLLSFDVSIQVFHALSSPDNLQMLEIHDPHSPKWISLTTWNEPAALFSYHKERGCAIHWRMGGGWWC